MDENADVQEFVRFFTSNTQRLVQRRDVSQYWDDVYVADPSVFKVFTHKILYGDPATALEGPRDVAISRRLAERYSATRIRWVRPSPSTAAARRASRSSSTTCPPTPT